MARHPHRRQTRKKGGTAPRSAPGPVEFPRFCNVLCCPAYQIAIASIQNHDPVVSSTDRWLTARPEITWTLGHRANLSRKKKNYGPGFPSHTVLPALTQIKRGACLGILALKCLLARGVIFLDNLQGTEVFAVRCNCLLCNSFRAAFNQNLSCGCYLVY